MGTSRDVLEDEICELEEKLKKARNEKANFKKAYNILMEYWDSLPEDEREEVHKKLLKCGV